MHSKSRWYEHGEKSSKYFLNLEKRNKAKSHVRSLISESGIQVNDPAEIMSKVRDFYSNLYTRRSTKTEKECLDYLSRLQIPRLSKTDLSRLQIPRLSNIDRDSCEGMLTKKECWEALNAMKKWKKPRQDGLTKEFYVCFFNEISDSLVAALNRSFEVSQLSSSQRQAVIVLIEKKEKDNRLIKNWRPISLVNVDSKIASEALASRMKTVLSDIIKCDQTAYVKGMYIGESIRLVTDILEYTAEHEEVGILFSADFEKAFDSFEHTFIFATLYKDNDIRTKLTALKVAWVTKLLDDNFHPWKIIPTILFTIFGGINNVFHHNFKASKQCRSKVNRLSKFCQELIQLWSEVGEKSVRMLQKFVVKYSGIMLGLCPMVRPFTISILLTKVF